MQSCEAGDAERQRRLATMMLYFQDILTGENILASFETSLAFRDVRREMPSGSGASPPGCFSFSSWLL